MTSEAERVLHELEVRADRIDSRPLDAIAEELGTTLASLDTAAERAEYFIAELGPVPPVEVLPYLRVVAASLACRPEPPDDLVEEFKNAWGSMEVLGGTPDDRLLAAELIASSGVDQGSFYSPMMNVVDRLRSDGCSMPLATGVLLELRPSSENGRQVEAWAATRRRTGSDVAAALVTGIGPIEGAVAGWEAWTRVLDVESTRHPVAAAYLASRGPPTPELVRRVRDVAVRLRASFGNATLAAALLTSLLPYSTSEVADWLDKAVQFATARQLAPVPAELSVIGLALLRGGTFPEVPSMALTETGGDPGLAAHVALHAGLFRDTRRPIAPR